MSEAKEIYAVLTGDIVKSTSLNQDDLESVRAGLLGSVEQVKGWSRGLVKGKAEFFRGDAWQLMLTDPAKALRVGVFLRAALKAQGTADTRLSIGLGHVENLSTTRVSLSTGQAFTLSGHGLDSLNHQTNLTIQLPAESALARWMPVVAQLCDALIEEWTDRQAEIAGLALQPKEPTQEEISEMLTPPISRQAVTKALDGANWGSIRSALHRFEETDWSKVL